MKLTSCTFGLAALLLAATATPSAQAAGPFDGVYNGSLTPTTSGGAGCSEGGNTSRQVVDGSFVNRWANSDIRISVGADGTIDGSGNAGGRNGAMVTAKGKITGNLMTYDITSQRCSFHFEGRRR